MPENEIERLNNILLSAIEKKTKLTREEIKKKGIEDIESQQGIIIKKPRYYFEWEASEKVGWQYSNLKFVPESTYKKREKKLEKFLQI